MCPGRTWYSMQSRYLKQLKPKLYEKKGCLPSRARRQQTPNESSSEEDTCSWNSSSKEEEDEFLSLDKVNPIKTRTRLQFMRDWNGVKLKAVTFHNFFVFLFFPLSRHIFLVNILLITLESDTPCSLLQLLSIISFIVILSAPFIWI